MKQSESEVRLLGRMANLVLSCLTQEEARVVAARFLPQLFPGETGALFIRHSTQDLYDPIVFWGEERQWQSFSGQDCWSLRRRRIHIVREDKDQPACPHADHDPERWISLCIPMTAREDTGKQAGRGRGRNRFRRYPGGKAASGRPGGGCPYPAPGKSPVAETDR
ncbi:MAG: hypothetical protein NTV58_01920 [Deltaproteobacteria bacterium]|nr:hypothetical protein [Deltaproteobacteria bacterium]